MPHSKKQKILFQILIVWRFIIIESANLELNKKFTEYIDFNEFQFIVYFIFY